MSRTFRVRPIALLVACGLYGTLLTFASEDDYEGLEEVIVTAQKVEQNLEDVPSSVAVVPGSLLEESGANGMVDLNGVAPNVIIQGMVFVQNTANLAIRGVGFFDTDPFADQKTQVLIDGVPHARVTGLGNDHVDVKRVEVLRGPQGTLFGRNSLAGSFNFITRDPGETPGVSLRAALGKYGLRKYVAVAETGDQFSDMVRARLSASVRSYDGHITNAFNGHKLGGHDSTNLRLKVAHILPNVETKLVYYQVDQEAYGIPNSNVIQDPGGLADGDVHLVNIDTDGFNNSKERGFTLLSDVDVGAGSIAVVANTKDSDFLIYSDFDARSGAVPPAAGPNPALNVNVGFDIESGQESLELRFHDDHSDRWDYVVGAYAFWEESRRFFFQNLGPPFARDHSYENATTVTLATQATQSSALFAQTDYHIDDQLSLLLGVRLTEDNKDVVVTNYGLPLPAPQRPPIVLPAGTTWHHPTWKIGTKYESDNQWMGYFTVSTGYKAGGFTSRATIPENVGPYEAEFMTNYEVGLKTNLFRNRLRLSTALFFADYEDLVGFVRRLNSTGRGNEPINTNLGTVDINGLEFESSWLVTPNLSFNFALGLLDANWDTFVFDLNNDGIATDNSYLDVSMAPKLSSYGSIHHTVNLPNSTIETRFNARYQARYNCYGESNDEIFYRPGTTLLNGSIAWVWGARENRVSIYGRNLSDKQVPRMIIGASLFPVATYEPPRQIGIELKLNF